MDEQGRDAAAVVYATLVDFGFITSDDKSCVVDRQRIRRAKLKFRQQANAVGNSNSDSIQELYFDGKESLTLTIGNDHRPGKIRLLRKEHTVIFYERKIPWARHHGRQEGRNDL